MQNLKVLILIHPQVNKKFWDTVDVVDSSQTSYVIHNLKPGTDYYFRVIAENDTGRSKPYALPQPFMPRSRYGENRREM